MRAPMTPQKIKGMRILNLRSNTDCIYDISDLYCYQGVLGEVEIVPTFRCIDIGLSCSFETEAKSEEEVLKKVVDHAAKAHKMETIPPDVMAKIIKAIK